jgi:hypothetical protein
MRTQRTWLPTEPYKYELKSPRTMERPKKMERQISNGGETGQLRLNRQDYIIIFLL